MKSLQGNIKSDYKRYGKLSQQTIHLLDRKINNLKTIIGNTNILRWGKTIKQNPETLNDAIIYEEFKDLFLPRFEIYYRYTKIDNQIYYKHSRTYFPAVRNDYKIIFRNPISNKIESWSRIKSLSNKRKDHWPGPTSKDKSKFLYVKDIKKSEFRCYGGGLGLLVDENKLLLYAEFNRHIGTLKKTGKLSNLLKVECIRVKRNKGSGYKVNIHGYPISIADLERDFEMSSKYIKVPQFSP